MFFRCRIFRKQISSSKYTYKFHAILFPPDFLSTNGLAADFRMEILFQIIRETISIWKCHAKSFGKESLYGNVLPNHLVNNFHMEIACQMICKCISCDFYVCTEQDKAVFCDRGGKMVCGGCGLCGLGLKRCGRRGVSRSCVYTEKSRGALSSDRAPPL